MNNAEITHLEESLVKAKAFYQYYEAHFNDRAWLGSSTLLLENEHAAEAGEVFGRANWEKVINYNKKFDWIKTVAGIRIVISNMEDIWPIMVDPKEFPLQLLEANE